MRDILKNALKIVLFSSLLIIIIEITTISLIPKEAIKKYGFTNTVSYSILEEKPDTIDVVALGDSLVYSSISPMEIWNEYGYPMYDCAEAGMTLEAAYDYLKIIIEYEHPKIVLLESNLLFRASDQTLWYYKAKKSLLEYIPITKFHNNWKRIGVSEEDDIRSVDKGYIYITRRVKYKPLDNIEDNHIIKRMTKKNYKIFQDMIALCKENNVQLTLISNPSQISWRYSKHHGAERIAQRFQLDFLDFNLTKEIDIDWANETKDDGDHLNHSGAKKVSAYIGKYLHETNLLTDKRNDPEYKPWNKASTIYNNHSDNY